MPTHMCTLSAYAFGWRMISSLADSGRVRRRLRHRTRSAPQCGVSCGPRAFGSGSPRTLSSESDGRRLLFSKLNQFSQDLLVVPPKVFADVLVCDHAAEVALGQN